MPEGHTIHRLARDHRQKFSGQVVTCLSPQGRFSDGAAAIDQRQLTDVFAHGKHLFYQFGGPSVEIRFCHVHLGLFGRFRPFTGRGQDPRPTTRWRLTTPEGGFDLSGPTQCRVVSQTDVDQVRARLGPDPLSESDELQRFKNKLSKTRRSVAAVLMDQSVIAGVGNIYRSELLWFTRIDPFKPANTLDDDQQTLLWSTARRWMRIGVDTNRIITTIPEGEKVPSRMTKTERVSIYKKDVCPECQNPVIIDEIAQRKLYFCEPCQADRA